MDQSYKEITMSKDIDKEKTFSKIRAQLQSLEMVQRNEHMEKDKLLKNFNPTTATNIEKIYLKILGESSIADHPKLQIV